MDFIKKFYLVRISKSSSKKSILDHKRSALSSDMNSDESLLSDYSDDEQVPVMTYRQRSNQKKAAKKSQFQKKKPSDTLYFDQKHDNDQLLRLTIKIKKTNDQDEKSDLGNKSKSLVTKDQVSRKNKLSVCRQVILVSLFY